MTLGTLRRAAVALTLMAPLSAAHSAPAAPAAADFAATFAAFAAVPQPAPATDTVDASAIVHSHPSAGDATPIAGGGASFYAAKFHGRRTASGERFDNGALTAAHRTLPFGSKVRVTNPANGRSVVVRINDRGPFHASRAIDVSRAAAVQLGIVARGHGTVELALLD